MAHTRTSNYHWHLQILCHIVTHYPTTTGSKGSHCRTVYRSIGTASFFFPLSLSLLLSILHDRTQALSGMEGVHCLVRSRHSAKGVGDKVVDLDFAVEHALDELGHVGPALESPKGGSLPDAAGHQLEGPGADLVAGRGDTDDAGGSPSAVGALECASHHLDISGAIKAVVHTPIGHGPGNVFLYRNVPERLGIDAIGSSQLLGHLELVGIDVDGNDPGGSGHLGTLYHGEAHSSQTKDGNGRVGFDLAGVPDGTETRRDPASEQTGLVEIRFLVDLGARNLGNHRVLRHGGATHEMKNGLSLAVHEAARSVRHESLPLGAADLGTEVGLGTLAKDAGGLAALGRVARNDVISRLDAGHALSDGFDDAAGLVSENARKKAFGIVAIKGVNVGVTQGIRHDLDADFSGLGRHHGDFLFDHGHLGCAGYQSLALDGF
mmetsp:Transcript_20636/g.57320  ORF Transcript_20636/g.57320 Transcript_20636/m.57320 type:complete len:435 (+) Transcript_20636:109-1413(+)